MTRIVVETRHGFVSRIMSDDEDAYDAVVVDVDTEDTDVMVVEPEKHVVLAVFDRAGV